MPLGGSGGGRSSCSSEGRVATSGIVPLVGSRGLKTARGVVLVEERWDCRVSRFEEVKAL